MLLAAVALPMTVPEPVVWSSELSSCSETGNLLDEDLHLVLGDGSVSVLVEFLEAGLEVRFGELAILSHFGEGVLDESLGLSLVEEATVVLVVGLPDVVNALFNDSVDV